MAQSVADNRLWEKEQELIKNESEKFPDLFKTPNIPDEKLRQRVGINISIPPLPKGYLKFSPLDFLVEEILPDGTIVSITENQNIKPPYEGEGTIYATLVKVGMSTLDAIQKISSVLSIDFRDIGYAGIKDNIALTGQRISFRNTDLEKVKSINIEGLILKDIIEGKGVITMGGLKGNRFTLLIRSNSPLDKSFFENQINSMGQNGVINFYGIQRFGHPRFLSHYLGKLILSGKIKELIWATLCQTSPFEPAYATNLRNSAAAKWGNWLEMEKIFSHMPYTLHQEVTVVKSIMANSGTLTQKVLDPIQEQIKFWTRSYASYLANLLLSAKASLSVTPENKNESIPLLLSENPENQRPYEDKLRSDGTISFRSNLRIFPYVKLSRDAKITVRTFPDFHQIKVVPEGLILSFTLPKGAYATTVLMSLFDISPNSEIVTEQNILDTKQELGEGSIEKIREHFSDVLRQMQPGSDIEETP